MTEAFRPVSNTRHNSFAGKLKFYGRMLLDTQLLTIYRDAKKYIPSYTNNVLDVGCGQSPFRFLLDPNETKYVGIDIEDAVKFGYENPDVIPFNGEDIPFGNEEFDAIICTEVLEHVEKYQRLVDEIYRVMKPGARGFFTIPWSARYHYIPYDFYRYTPSSLNNIFEHFSEVQIRPRGSDVATIGNKLIVLWVRNLFPAQATGWLFSPLWLLLTPIPAGAVIAANLSVFLKLGSDNDPLGYTIIVKK